MNLYREGLVHFLGGAAAVTRPIQIFSGSRAVGTQRLNLITDEAAFALTMLQGNSGTMREHLRRLLGHTGLRHIHWINLNRHRVEFVTLSSGAGLNPTEQCRDRIHDKAFSL